ncbi:MAG: adenine deaminase [Methanomassiliicoccales archaeon]
MVQGNFVDVVSGDIFPAKVSLYENRLVRIEEGPVAKNQYIIPGLIDAHVHIESSMLCPSRFAEAAVPHGVTSVVTDPHEIANVLGMKGVEYMVRDGREVPMRFFFTAPSCVPATPFETSGASLGWREVRELLEREDFVALGEVMNYPGVLNDDPDVIAKIEVAERLGKPVDGHAPGLSGRDLENYVFAGVTSDHECTTLEEAREKHDLGMDIMVREGSASKNMADLMPFARRNECMLVSDDMHAGDLVEGYMDRRLSQAVELGMDPVDAIRAASLWPSHRYHLPVGRVEVGQPADFVVVKDLESFEVLEVYIEGRLVAKDGRPLFTPAPIQAKTRIVPQDKEPQDFDLPHPGPEAEVRVIKVLPDQIASRSKEATLPVRGGVIKEDVDRDILRMAVINRYRPERPAVGFVSGFGLKRGAVASTVAHDSHNIVVVGTSTWTMAEAAREVADGGGLYATDGGKSMHLRLPIAGLMSDRPAPEVAEEYDRLERFVSELGCGLPAPFMTMSFQSLLVIPELKLGDRGLFDSTRMEFVDVVVEKNV